MSKVHKGKAQHKSMRGKIVDMDLLRKKNELTPAVGNARVNARGDELGPGGKIVRKREDIIREYYDNNTSAVKEDSGRARKKPVTIQEEAEKAALTEEEQELFEEIQEEDEWIEDEDGNFIQKGEK
jgi:hypothetical protein